jgi:hypothetical protein
MMTIFEEIATVTRPDPVRFICEMDYQINAAAGIFVTLWTVANEPDSVVEAQKKPICILHIQLSNWLKDEGYLEGVSDTSDHTGSHVQKTWTIDYEEFIKNHLDSGIIYKYLKAKNITSLQYDPTLA